MSEIYELSASSIIAGIKCGQLSCVEVAAAFLQRIAVINPSLNAIVQQVDPDIVLQQARLADDAIAQGKSLGKLHGLPVTIKDSFKVKGMVGSAGSKGLAHQADTDATAVERLRAEGAIILGITNVPELLLCAETDNSLYGRTNNPYDLDRTPGGSSGGEAAIIAAGGSALGIGSDGGGSIRVPAHFCGLAGIKPTQGLIPLTGSLLGDTPGIFGSVVANGPLARSVDDLTLALSILAGPDRRDFRALPIKFQDLDLVDLKGLRVAYHTDNGVAKACDATVETLLRSVKCLEPHVACIAEKTPPGLENTMKLLWETIFLGGDRGAGLQAFLQYLKVDQPSPLLQKLITVAKECEFSVQELRMRFIEIDKFNLDMFAFLQEWDVIICPVAATPAKIHGTTLQQIADFSYTMSYNLCGAPAVAVPCGMAAGLPIGLQVIARPWRDDIALAVARLLESENISRRPRVAWKGRVEHN